MPKYLVLIYEDEQRWIDEVEVTEEVMAGHDRFHREHAGAIVAGNALQPTATATSLRTDASGAVQVTDGPFVETKEALGGFYLLEADDVEAAVELAKQIPAPFGGHEVRPVMVFG